MDGNLWINGEEYPAAPLKTCGQCACLYRQTHECARLNDGTLIAAKSDGANVILDLREFSLTVELLAFEDDE